MDNFYFSSESERIPIVYSDYDNITNFCDFITPNINNDQMNESIEEFENVNQESNYDTQFNNLTSIKSKVEIKENPVM